MKRALKVTLSVLLFAGLFAGSVAKAHKSHIRTSTILGIPPGWPQPVCPPCQ